MHLATKKEQNRRNQQEINKERLKEYGSTVHNFTGLER